MPYRMSSKNVCHEDERASAHTSSVHQRPNHARSGAAARLEPERSLGRMLCIFHHN